jgi:hypothetical protein
MADTIDSHHSKDFRWPSSIENGKKNKDKGRKKNFEAHEFLASTVFRTSLEPCEQHRMLRKKKA